MSRWLEPEKHYRGLYSSAPTSSAICRHLHKSIFQCITHQTLRQMVKIAEDHIEVPNLSKTESQGCSGHKLNKTGQLENWKNKAWSVESHFLL